MQPQTFALHSSGNNLLLLRSYNGKPHENHHKFVFLYCSYVFALTHFSTRCFSFSSTFAIKSLISADFEQRVTKKLFAYAFNLDMCSFF